MKEQIVDSDLYLWRIKPTEKKNWFEIAQTFVSVLFLPVVIFFLLYLLDKYIHSAVSKWITYIVGASGGFYLLFEIISGIINKNSFHFSGIKSMILTILNGLILYVMYAGLFPLSEVFSQNFSEVGNLILLYLDAVVDTLSIGFYDLMGFPKISPEIEETGSLPLILHLLKVLIAAGVIQMAYLQLKFQRKHDFLGTEDECFKMCELYDEVAMDDLDTYEIEMLGKITPKKKSKTYNMSEFTGI